MKGEFHLRSVVVLAAALASGLALPPLHAAAAQDLDGPRTGICCLTGTCLTTLEEDVCLDAGGSWYSEWFDCDPNPCPNTPPCVCCLPDGGCEILGLDDCLGLGGDYRYDLGQLPCELDPCEWESAVCCLDGICIFMTEYSCDVIGGTWHPAHDFCGDVDCSEPVSVCCVGALCYLVWEEDCTILDGRFFPLLESCDPNPCEGQGIEDDGEERPPDDGVSWGRVKTLYRR